MWAAQMKALCQSSADSDRGCSLLQALDAEVVVLFEGVTETGALFSGKRSYLPTEIHWGYVFSEITHQSNSAGRFHAVDLSKYAPFLKDLARMATCFGTGSGSGHLAAAALQMRVSSC